MKEDVLEQIADDYLQFKGYFTTHNVPFRPRSDRRDFVSRSDSVPSDIDIIGFHPRKRGVGRVVVVTCKSWQAGFDADAKLAELRGTKRGPARDMAPLPRAMGAEMERGVSGHRSRTDGCIDV